MEFITDRLIIRPWREEDADSLYEYAKNPEVGPIAGWPVHTSVENSLDIIRNVLSADGTYAVCLKSDNKAIGSVGLIPPMQSHTKAAQDELEIGYWIGKPFWGRGLIPEAVKRLMKYAFEELNCSAIWCGYYDGNEKSKRCQEKCGFIYHHTEKDKPCELMGDIRTEHFTRITREEWRYSGNSNLSVNQTATILSYNACAEQFHKKVAKINNYDETYNYFCDILHDGCKVLDLACGPAQISKYIVNKVNCKITGVDLSNKMLEIARKEIPDGVFKEHSIIDYNDGCKYDACVLGFGIPYLHSEEVKRCICNVADIIMDKGVFYISFMNTKCESDEEVKLEKTSFGGDNLFEIHYHNKDKIVSYLTSAGFTIVKKYELPYYEQDKSVTTDIVVIGRKDKIVNFLF